MASRTFARRLPADGFVHILCSDLVRARMTAAPLAARPGIKIEESPLLQERNFGDLRGMPYADVDENPFGPGLSHPTAKTGRHFTRASQMHSTLSLSRRRSVNGKLVVVTHG